MNVNKVIKTLRCDSSLQFDQIIKLIPIDKKIHWCSDCGKPFTCANYLCRHEKSRTGVKPSEYSHCGKAFACHSYHQRHERIHTG